MTTDKANVSFGSKGVLAICGTSAHTRKSGEARGSERRHKFAIENRTMR